MAKSPASSKQLTYLRERSVSRRSSNSNYNNNDETSLLPVKFKSCISSKDTKNKNKNNQKNGRNDNDKKVVSFYRIEIREYNRCVGDNPSVTAGAPISIGWEYNKKHKYFNVAQYESYRGGNARRKQVDYRLSPETRRDLLKDHGFTTEEIEKATEAAKKINLLRKATNQANPALEKTTEVIENVSRNFKKFVNLGYPEKKLKALIKNAKRQVQEQANLEINNPRKRMIAANKIIDMQRILSLTDPDNEIAATTTSTGNKKSTKKSMNTTSSMSNIQTNDILSKMRRSASLPEMKSIAKIAALTQTACAVVDNNRKLRMTTFSNTEDCDNNLPRFYQGEGDKRRVEENVDDFVFPVSFPDTFVVETTCDKAHNTEPSMTVRDDCFLLSSQKLETSLTNLMPEKIHPSNTFDDKIENSSSSGNAIGKQPKYYRYDKENNARKDVLKKLFKMTRDSIAPSNTDPSSSTNNNNKNNNANKLGIIQTMIPKSKKGMLPYAQFD